MKIAITGANGFIGQHVVEKAIAAGHEVLAIVRSKAPSHWQEYEQIHVHHCDLLNSDSLHEAISGCNALIHLAAVMGGANQYEDTITATKNVLAQMEKAEVPALVGLSSISVLDYTKQAPLSTIDESTPVNTRDKELGPYAAMKRDQETLYKAWRKNEKQLVIVRPGIVYAKDNLSTAHVGFLKGSNGFAAHHKGCVPVVHVEDVAQALVEAVLLDINETTVHLLNDALPDQNYYLNTLKEETQLGATIPLPWQLFSLLMATVRLPLSLIGKVPDSFRHNSVAARQKPFQFSNEKAKKLLHWQPRAAINH